MSWHYRFNDKQMSMKERRERWWRALDELNRPPKFGTNATAMRNMSLARACEWDPEADRPSRMRGKYHGLATSKIGVGNHSLRLCKDCARRNAARCYARVAVLQPGRILREVKR